MTISIQMACLGFCTCLFPCSLDHCYLHDFKFQKYSFFSPEIDLPRALIRVYLQLRTPQYSTLENHTAIGMEILKSLPPGLNILKH